ncbi:unnamed protein product, partial [Urochloa humidicola]
AAAAVDEAEPRAPVDLEPAQLRLATASTAPCVATNHLEAHGLPEDPDNFDDVDYAEEEDKDNTSGV